MLKNYFLLAYRNLRRNGSYTVINILGLSVGIAVCLLIFMVVHFELSFDNFHSKKERIFRVLTKFEGPDGTSLSAGVPFPTPGALRTDYPQLSKVTAVMSNEGLIAVTEDKTQAGNAKKFREEEGVFFVDPEFFEIFDFPFLSGTYTALNKPNMAVLSKSTAEKYFGDWKSAIGKTFLYNNRELLQVTGILQDVPSNTDFQIKVAISFSTSTRSKNTDWRTVSSAMGTYVLLPENMSPAQFDKQLLQFVKKYKKEEHPAKHQLESISEVHYQDHGNFLQRSISKKLIQTLSLVALFLLLIACVNFINLSTAQAVNRSKEVGVRKVLGSNRLQLSLQFMAETALITIAAVLLSILIAIAAVPLIKNILELPLSAEQIATPWMMIFLLSVTVAVTLLSGFYPAIIISGYNPIAALKNKIRSKTAKGISLRRGLVVGQFVIAQVLIIGTLIVLNQMNFFMHAKLGFDKDAIVNIPLPGDSISRTKVDYMRNELHQVKGVRAVSFSFASPSDNGNWYSDFKYNNAPKSVEWGANLKWADADYFKTYNIPLVAGRPYTQSDTVREFVVNETLVKKLGLLKPEEVIGKTIDFWDGVLKGNIVGVVKDFHAVSLHQEMSPIVMSTYKATYGTIGMKLDGENMKSTIENVEKLWTRTFPEYVFEYEFLDKKIANFYQQERQLLDLYKIFATIAIFISCLGLYGLAAFMSVQRVKEVGIRKVLGATVNNILVLFSKEFVLLVFIAFAVAAPIAWYLMHLWLNDFQYRIPMNWWIFALAGLMAITVALFTISVQAIRSAVANPVKSLRNE
ncbi:MAG TPA: ABC transporter permease [Flavitalea sp.]|nr:ABC transporter permease [Flavitalea sp.]